MSELDWINDKLHDLIGMSEAHLINYVKAIGNSLTHYINKNLLQIQSFKN